MLLRFSLFVRSIAFATHLLGTWRRSFSFSFSSICTLVGVADLPTIGFGMLTVDLLERDPALVPVPFSASACANTNVVGVPGSSS